MVDLYNIDLVKIIWSKLDRPVELMVSEKPFASGGFHEAYKASSLTNGFQNKTWVVKKYLPETLNVIDMEETAGSHTKKAVQMLAKAFGDQLAKEVSATKCTEFGLTLCVTVMCIWVKSARNMSQLKNIFVVCLLNIYWTGVCKPRSHTWSEGRMSSTFFI